MKTTQFRPVCKTGNFMQPSHPVSCLVKALLCVLGWFLEKEAQVVAEDEGKRGVGLGSSTAPAQL